MILMRFKLSDTRFLIIPARNFLSITDSTDGKGSVIIYNMDDVERIVQVASELSAAVALDRVYEAVST